MATLKLKKADLEHKLAMEGMLSAQTQAQLASELSDHANTRQKLDDETRTTYRATQKIKALEIEKKDMVRPAFLNHSPAAALSCSTFSCSNMSCSNMFCSVLGGCLDV